MADRLETVGHGERVFAPGGEIDDGGTGVRGAEFGVRCDGVDATAVVVDEEPDAAYKSDRTPRIQARDAAMQLARLAGAGLQHRRRDGVAELERDPGRVERAALVTALDDHGDRRKPGDQGNQQTDQDLNDERRRHDTISQDVEVQLIRREGGKSIGTLSAQWNSEGVLEVKLDDKGARTEQLDAGSAIFLGPNQWHALRNAGDVPLRGAHDETAGAGTGSRRSASASGKACRC